MEIENLKLYRDTAWTDLKIRFCGHSKCMPNHTYGPGSRPYYLLHIVFAGKGKLIVNKKEYSIKAGQLFLVEPDQMIFYQADDIDPWEYSWVGFNGELADYFITKLGLGYPNLIRELPENDFCEAKKLLEDIIKIDSNDITDDLNMFGLFLILLSKIGRDALLKSSSQKKEVTSAEEYVQKAITIVENYYGEDLAVTDIASRLNINRSYLSSIFVKSVGIPLKKYIVDFRISQSEELLFTTSWSVDYISKLCGFNSPAYFTKIFKKYHNVSPSEYRKIRLDKQQTSNFTEE